MQRKTVDSEGGTESSVQSSDKVRSSGVGSDIETLTSTENSNYALTHVKYARGGLADGKV